MTGSLHLASDPTWHLLTNSLIQKLVYRGEKRSSVVCIISSMKGSLHLANDPTWHLLTNVVKQKLVYKGEKRFTCAYL